MGLATALRFFAGNPGRGPAPISGDGEGVLLDWFGGERLVAAVDELAPTARAVRAIRSETLSDAWPGLTLRRATIARQADLAQLFRSVAQARCSRSRPPGGELHGWTRGEARFSETKSDAPD